MSGQHTLGKSIVFLDTELTEDEHKAMVRVLDGSDPQGFLFVRDRDIDADAIKQRNENFVAAIQEACPDLVFSPDTHDAYVENAVQQLSLSAEVAKQKFSRRAALEWKAEDESFAAYLGIEDDNIIVYFALGRILEVRQIDAALLAFRKVYAAVQQATEFPVYDAMAKIWLDDENIEDFWEHSEKAAEEMLLYQQRYQAQVAARTRHFFMFNITACVGAFLIFCLSMYFSSLVADVSLDAPVRFEVVEQLPASEDVLWPEFKLSGTTVTGGDTDVITVSADVYQQAAAGDVLEVYETHKAHKPFISKEEYEKYTPIFDIGFGHVNSLALMALLMGAFPLVVYRRWLRLQNKNERNAYVLRAVRSYWVGTVAVLLGGLVALARLFF